MQRQFIQVCLSVLAGLGWLTAAALSAETLSVVRDETMRPGENLLANPGFERSADSVPDGWSWDPRTTDATLENPENPRTGQKSLWIASTTEFCPHVYANLTLSAPVKVEAGKTYTLSVYCSSDGNPMANLAWGEEWKFRLPLKDTRGVWKRFSKTFVADTDDVSLNIISEGPTEGFFLDDIKLEEGDRATFFVDHDVEGKAWILLDLPELLRCPAAGFSHGFLLIAPPGAAQGRAVVEDGQGTPLSACDFPVEAGVNPLQLRWKLPETLPQPLRVRVQAGGTESAAETGLVTPAAMDAAVAAVLDAGQELETLIAQADGQQKRVPHARAACVIAKRFAGIAREKYDVDRVTEAAADLRYMQELLAENTALTRRILAGDIPDTVIPDPALTRIEIRDGNFIAEGKPVMLVGAMGFSELRADLEDYKEYGFNTIDGDFYSDAAFKMMKGEGQFNEEAAPGLVEWWKKFADMNLANSFNPTLHYFPFWAMQQYVDITGGDEVDRLPDWSGKGGHKGARTKQYGGFFPFAIDSQNLRRLVSAYYEKLLPELKDAPGFCVVWLMNEPTYRSKDENYVGLFRTYLQTKFRDIGKLNEAWKTSFASFSDITHDDAQKTPAVFDWLTFHQDQVAGWFEWLGTEAKKHLPQAALSNKPMAWTLLHPAEGIDFEREAELWEVPGCDSGRSPESRDYSFNWAEGSLLFDFQKSIAPQKPLADHEYHYVHWPDVPSEYVRAAYFHSYLHGLRKSEFWYWSKGELNPAVLGGAGSADTAWSQPRVAWGTSTAALDLRRLSEYVAAFPGKPEVFLYFSRPSLYLDQRNTSHAIRVAYESANGLDAPLGFMTDRMIHGGRLSSCKLLLVPRSPNVQADVLEKIEAYRAAGGNIIFLDECLKRDEYNRPYAAAVSFDGKAGVKQRELGKARQLAGLLEESFTEAGIARPVRCITPEGGLAWPVECRAATVNGKTVVYLIGLNPAPVTVRLHAGQTIKGWRDLMSDETQPAGDILLNPLDVRMLELSF